MASDKGDKGDKRTKLNAELAHNYGQPRKRAATPGRNALTLTEADQLVDAVEPELEEQEQEAQAVEGQEVADREPKKSLFELPRKEPSRQPLPASPFSAPVTSSSAPPTSSPQPPAAPRAQTTKPK